MKNIEKSVMKILLKNSFVQEEILCSDNLNSLGIDSLALVEVIVELEDEFEVVFNDSELNSQMLETVQDLIHLVEKNLS